MNLLNPEATTISSHNKDLEELACKIRLVKPFEKVGHVVAINKTYVKVEIKNVKIGEICKIAIKDSDVSKYHYAYGEVSSIGLKHVNISLSGNTFDIVVGAPVYALGRRLGFKVGKDLVGEIVDEKGKFRKNQNAFSKDLEVRYFDNVKVDALSRVPIDKVFETGIKSIDACITLGQGQRIGLFGPAGCGKSTLMAMIARNCVSDICIVLLIGERGREVNDFLMKELTAKHREKCIVFFSTSDSSSIERIWGVRRAIIAAEYFASLGQNVLLIMDSLTRYCRAQRELAIQSGEPPVRHGFPQSVFDQIPQLVERSGNFKTGCITSIFVVLEESEYIRDSLAEEIISLLDGHIILSRELAEKSHYPAIDVRKSNSRLMHRVASKDMLENARKLKSLQTKYNEIEILLQLGEYSKGSDEFGDLAIACEPKISNFLKQTPDENISFSQTLIQLREATNG